MSTEFCSRKANFLPPVQRWGREPYSQAPRPTLPDLQTRDSRRSLGCHKTGRDLPLYEASGPWRWVPWPRKELGTEQGRSFLLGLSKALCPPRVAGTLGSSPVIPSRGVASGRYGDGSNMGIVGCPPPQTLASLPLPWSSPPWGLPWVPALPMVS